MRGERGQTAVEWIGLAVVVVALVLALVSVAPSVGGAVLGGVRHAVCQVTGGSGESRGS